MKLTIVATILLILALSVCQAAPASYIASKYTISGSLTLNDMNDSCLIVGVENNRALKVDNGVKTFLQTPSQYIRSKALAVGDSGIIVGSVCTSSYNYKPCYWDLNGEMHLLPDLGESGEATAINSKNQIAGPLVGAGYDGWATLWTNFTQRKTLASSGYMVRGINDQGTVIANTVFSGACYWSDTERRFVVLGMPAGQYITDAKKINNRGQILGALGPDFSDLPQVVWTDYKNPRILPRPLGLNGYTRPCQASDINDSGLVVGKAYATGYQPQTACIWDDFGVYLLDDLVTGVFDGQNELTGVSFTNAYFINNNNQILCQGKYNNEYSYYMLTPVPEPSSLLTLICGLGGIAALRRRR